MFSALKKRVVLIDMDETYHHIIRSFIEQSDKLTWVAGYYDPQEAIRNAEKDKASIVISELAFPNVDPIDYVKLLLDKTHLIDLLIATDYDDESLVMEVISCGAHGYILKKNLSGFMHAIEAISQGGSPLDYVVARKLVTQLHIARSSPLTRQESVVLRLITQGKTYAMIAAELRISHETSKTHIRNIYRKLNVNSKTEAVRKAIADRLVHVG